MELINQFVLAGAALLLLAILASALSYRTGMPLLLVFLAVGMLAGEDGPGGIVFNDTGIAYSIGSVALAVILLGGGLNTRAESFRAGLRPAAGLATLGVLITCVITGLFAAWVLDFGLLQGMLVGAVASSTDAAAVFALLHAKGLTLKQRVSATLEIESGSNDPMAVILTIVLLDLITAGQGLPGWDTLSLFALQMGMGLVAGIGGGRLLVWLTHRLRMEPGMYPMLILAGGLTLYGLTTVLGGSGYLAIYLAGVVIGNRAPRESRNILQVHGGLSWLAQIGMFLMLGLLATPSRLLDDAPAALAIALVLMFVARPLAVWLCLLPFRFPPREQIFIAWVGLRGAVPIILALFPLLAGVPEAHTVLDVAFFVVLISLTLQGWSIPYLARRLRLEVPPAPEADERFDLGAGANGHTLFGYRLAPQTPVLDRSAADLALPGTARLITVLRNGAALSPEAAGNLATGDVVYVLARQDDSAALGELLVSATAPAYLEKRQFYGDFTVGSEADMASVAELYGLPLPEGAARMTLADFLADRLHGVPVAGDRFRLGNIEFVVREVEDERITRVGLRIPTHLQ
ncbi:potassium/proton antiporter (CPA1 family) [Sulfuritortus calidifontis]|uniref:Potassium/proton antiporter (CPA1 family) n=1 Tax=Sulfuritortus calidifontis TaxID=1914471 RepID=A0A4R3JS58_9PROT|nr:potassium/proton antiporter [Sulfuritortus calidifontis]TCS69999.1 potassium/proton antiporter (CPA1 family) [Sulfuritortus calidifontis]